LKALILAGGLGTRLRPLSCTRPKILFPIANVPLIDLTLERLASNSVVESVLAVNFMAEKLQHTLGCSKHGMKLTYSRDAPISSSKQHAQRALGTGGPVKQAERILGSKEPFFVMNGDILSKANYAIMMEEHKSAGCVATIALARVTNPSRYGIVKVGSNRRIESFIEKPVSQAGSALVNAGIYVFEPEIFDYIPVNKKCSLERAVFPRLADEGRLLGYKIENLWVDVGKPEDYIVGNKLWIKASGISAIPRAVIDSRVQIEDAVAIDEGVTLGEESILGPNLSLGKGVRVGKRVLIRDSIVFPNTIISNSATIEGSIIGESVTIERDVKIKGGCLIGDNALIQEGITLPKNVKICPSVTISESVEESHCMT
jgi:mannose-1-phosphate guanylyltransferase